MMEDMPPGYRFYPTEEELILFYLRNKLEGEREDMNRLIPVVDIYDYTPSQLPQISGEANLKDSEQWFFFIPQQESETRGGRPKRLTNTGYWKATGSPNHVYSSDNRIIGMKRTMVFYSGRAPNGKKTDWKMNEYKAIDTKSEAASSSSSSSNKAAVPMLRQEFSLCRVYKKSKCLRAFDRRPPPRRDMVTYASTSNVQNAQEINQRASTSYNNQDNNNNNNNNTPQMGEMRSGVASSPDSSCSEDRGQMDVDNEPLLSWEQVYQFLASPEP